eukprot:g787.t1
MTRGHDVWILTSVLNLALFTTSAATTISIRVNISEPIATTSPSFLGVNIDAASLYQQTRLDFEDSTLLSAACRLGRESDEKMTLRIGGSAADDLATFRKNGTESILLDEAYWDQIVEFSRTCGLNLAWDLNMRVGRSGNGSNSWDPQDATRLIRRIKTENQSVWAFQLGNEAGHWQTRNGGSPNAIEHAEDFLTLQSMLDAEFSEDARPRLQGADLCRGMGTDTSPCANRTYFRDFLRVAGHVLDDVTVHTYGLTGPKAGREDQCDVSNFLNRTLFSSQVMESASEWKRGVEDLAPDANLVMSETATAADGGCPGLSNRFVAGFYFVHILGELADLGFWQVYRQDLIGFSGIGGGSSYALLGTPGWYSEGAQGPLRPNPDFFTTALQRRLVGRTRFRVTSEDAEGENVFHAACAKGGGVVLSFTNPTAKTLRVVVSFETGAGSQDRFEANGELFEVYVLTAPRGNLTADYVEMNGVVLTNVTDAMEPGFSSTLSLPPFSYGYVVDRSIDAVVC